VFRTLFVNHADGTRCKIQQVDDLFRVRDESPIARHERGSGR
jgi:hypothetical protein